MYDQRGGQNEGLDMRKRQERDFYAAFSLIVMEIFVILLNPPQVKLIDKWQVGKT